MSDDQAVENAAINATTRIEPTNEPNKWHIVFRGMFTFKVEDQDLLALREAINKHFAVQDELDRPEAKEEIQQLMLQHRFFHTGENDD